MSKQLHLSNHALKPNYFLHYNYDSYLTLNKLPYAYDFTRTPLIMITFRMTHGAHSCLQITMLVSRGNRALFHTKLAEMSDLSLLWKLRKTVISPLNKTVPVPIFSARDCHQDYSR